MNFKSFSRSLKQFFLIVGQNNFGIKIPFFKLFPVGFFIQFFLFQLSFSLFPCIRCIRSDLKLKNVLYEKLFLTLHCSKKLAWRSHTFGKFLEFSIKIAFCFLNHKEYFFLPLCQKNFRNKILFLHFTIQIWTNLSVSVV